jgi:hypothetical protein
VRRALLVVGVGVAVCVAALLAASHVFAYRTSASASFSIGPHAYVFSGGGSCQKVGGDFSAAVASAGHSFHLIWTPADRGGFRTVSWRYSYVTHGTVLHAKIKLTDGRTRGAFSGVSTDGARITGSFSCG